MNTYEYIQKTLDEKNLVLFCEGGGIFIETDGSVMRLEKDAFRLVTKTVGIALDADGITVKGLGD